MGVSIKTGKNNGFTLMELMIVMALIAILASIGVPMYQRSVVKAREAVLKEDIYQLRDAIDKYYADRGAYPESLGELKNAKYVRSIPVDPFTGSEDTWVAVPADDRSGVYDVKSGSSMTGLNGVAYNEW